MDLFFDIFWLLLEFEVVFLMKYEKFLIYLKYIILFYIYNLLDDYYLCLMLWRILEILGKGSLK